MTSSGAKREDWDKGYVLPKQEAEEKKPLVLRIPKRAIYAVLLISLVTLVGAAYSANFIQKSAVTPIKWSFNDSHQIAISAIFSQSNSTDIFYNVTLFDETGASQSNLYLNQTLVMFPPGFLFSLNGVNATSWQTGTYSVTPDGSTMVPFHLHAWQGFGIGAYQMNATVYALP